MGVPYAEADKMAKLIPEELGITLSKAYEKEPKIKELTGSDPVANRVWEFALQLEGLKRNAGTHAAGLVISNEPLWHKTPLYRPSGTQDVVTQYDGRFLEDVDLIKFDFLGLKTLTVIKNALDWIEIRHKKRINFSEMPMEDEAVFETIQTGHTLGLFQIESSGMQQLNAKMKPGSFEDLIAVLALYRPGPMESGMVDDFINRKHGREAITYMFDDLEPILAPTYGVIVYQEQVMQIMQTIGGFSLGKADLVRRAMGKKKFEEMERFRAEFARGAAAQGHDEAKAVELFDLIEKFAGYGFNKSHSAAYAMITYQTAWLKTHYPAEFMAALLTSEADNTDKIASYIEEVKRMGIAFLPPAINQSGIDFTPLYNEDESAQILFGLGAIKGVGESALRTVLNVRKDAPFETLEDFAGRIDTQKVNKKVIEALVKSGALDHFGHTRRTLMSYIDTIVSSAQSATQIRKEAKSGLFGDEVEEMATVRLEINPMEEYPPKELLALEKESLGIYVSGHPLDDFKEALSGFSYTLTSELDELADGSEVLLVGKVEEIKEKFSKRGNKIGIITLMDWHGAMEVMLFERQLSTLLEMDQTRPIGFKAQVSKDDQFTRITVRRILTLEECAKEKVRTKMAEVKPEAEASVPVITLAIDLESDEQRLEKLLALIRAHPGRHPVSLVIRAKLQDVYIETRLQAGEALREAARDLGAYELAA